MQRIIITLLAMIAIAVGATKASAEDLYIRGNFNNWAADASSKMTETGSGTEHWYYINLSSMSIPSGADHIWFKIANADWSLVYGCTNQDDPDMTISEMGRNSWRELTRQYGTELYDLNIATGVSFTNVVVAFNLSTRIIRIAPQLWLAGESIGSSDWSINDSYRFTSYDANYYWLDGVTLNANKPFVITHSSWGDYKFGLGAQYSANNVAYGPNPSFLEHNAEGTVGNLTVSEWSDCVNFGFTLGYAELTLKRQNVASDNVEISRQCYIKSNADTWGTGIAMNEGSDGWWYVQLDQFPPAGYTGAVTDFAFKIATSGWEYEYGCDTAEGNITIDKMQTSSYEWPELSLKRLGQSTTVYNIKLSQAFKDVIVSFNHNTRQLRFTPRLWFYGTFNGWTLSQEMIATDGNYYVINGFTLADADNFKVTHSQYGEFEFGYAQTSKSVSIAYGREYILQGSCNSGLGNLVAPYAATDLEVSFTLSTKAFKVKRPGYNDLTLESSTVKDRTVEYMRSSNQIRILDYTTGVEDVAVTADAYGEPEYYTLQGRRLSERPTTPGIYIVRRGNTATKQLITGL